MLADENEVLLRVQWVCDFGSFNTTAHSQELAKGRVETLQTLEFVTSSWQESQTSPRSALVHVAGNEFRTLLRLRATRATRVFIWGISRLYRHPRCGATGTGSKWGTCVRQRHAGPRRRDSVGAAVAATAAEAAAVAAAAVAAATAVAAHAAATAADRCCQ